MAAHQDDMFSFCVEPGKVSASVEVRFIDNIKVIFLTFSPCTAVFMQLCLREDDEEEDGDDGEIEATCRPAGAWRGKWDELSPHCQSF